MTKAATAFIGSIYSSHKNCDCGGSYERHPHPQFGILAPFCGDCGEIAARFKYRRRNGRKIDMDLSCDKSGKLLLSMEQVIATSEVITKEIRAGVFDHRDYLRKDGPGSLAEPVSLFINREVLKCFPEKEADPDYLYLRDFIAPYFVDVGVFSACEAHISFFIRDMGLIKNHQREYAKRLWNKVLEIASPRLQAA